MLMSLALAKRNVHFYNQIHCRKRKHSHPIVSNQMKSLLVLLDTCMKSGFTQRIQRDKLPVDVNSFNAN